MNKNQAYQSNRKTVYFTLVLGVIMALAAIAFALDIGGISTLVPLAGKAVWGFAGCAFALIACGIFTLIRKPTPKELIEQGDERNIAISNLAAMRAFAALSVLLPLSALLLYIFEQLSTIGLLAIIALDVIAFIVYVACLTRGQKTM